MKFKKRNASLLFASTLVVASLTACGGSSSSTAEAEAPATTEAEAPATTEAAAPEATPEAASEVNAAVFYYQYSDVYISSVRSAMDAELNTLGVTFNNYDGANNQAQQSDQINTAITNGANLLIVNIVETSSSDAAQAAVEIARSADIPIVFFNREVSDDVVSSYEKCAFVGTNAPEAGHMQGQMVGDFLLENYDAIDLNGDGEISYVMFKGQEGNAEAEARTQFGVEDADTILTADGKSALAFYDAANSAKYLVDQDGAWSAKAATDYMDVILAQYSEANDNMIEIVIANNDGMAEGAVASLQTAGYNLGDGSATTIPVFGVDATESAKQLIDEGKMTGTVKQDAEGMASTIATLVSNVGSGAELMDNTGSFNVDDGISKIRVPYGLYIG
ncbi:MAG: galactose ABC transporter substrate-binding protein [Bacillota bacterium]